MESKGLNFSRVIAAFLMLMFLSISGCDVIGGIFKTGVGVGAFVVIIVVILVLALFIRRRR